MVRHKFLGPRNAASIGISARRNQRSASAARYASTYVYETLSDQYQLLHKSLIPTYHFQDSLPRLPVPKLEDTCMRYLNSFRAISSTAEYERVEKVVEKFMQGEGQELQKELIANDKRNKATSYISEAWYDMYLSSRLPCPINYNPFMMYASDPIEASSDQLSRATNFVISCGRFKKTLDSCLLAPEVFHMDPKKSDTKLFQYICRILPRKISWYGAYSFNAFPLDMNQYPSLFGGNRIPSKGKDILHSNKQSQHIVVVRNGLFYTLNIFDPYGNLYPPNQIHHCISEILRSEDNAAPDECIGSLTTLERDAWAEIRSEIIAADAIKNKESLSLIDDGLFLLCLDNLKTEDPSRLIQSLLCGDDGRNRWFDKCFQLIIDNNGQATINFEHSWGDGVAVLRLMEETYRDTSSNCFIKPNQKPDAHIKAEHHVKKLEWTLTPNIRKKIFDAQQKHIKCSQELDFGTLQYSRLTRDKIKQCKLSPDAIMQLAIQMAFYSQYKEFAPTYESCSTAAFKHGRTECVRSATMETRETVLAFEKGHNTNTIDLIKNCSSAHQKLIKEASMGQGFDRHLFGLKVTAERLSRPIPSFFDDESFKKMGHFTISTSTLSTDTIVFGGFGPVVDDGLGIGYNVSSKLLGAVVTSKKESRDVKEFCKCLESSIDKINNVLERNDIPKKIENLK